MISRSLIRAKVLQVAYACHQKGQLDLVSAKNELIYSLRTSHQLYYHLLLLIVALTEREQRRLELLKRKYLPSLEEKNSSRRLADNRISVQLSANLALMDFRNQCLDFWNKNEADTIVYSLLHDIKRSGVYDVYLASENTQENDYVFWKGTFQYVVLKNKLLVEWLEEENIYWNGDLELMTAFALKTLQWKNLSEQPLFPMFRKEVDKKYALQLLGFALLERKKHTDLIDSQMKNWDVGHIALLDLLIMQVALSEIKHFPDIPLKVTMNEYIELARYYSTPQSPLFINGILQAIVSRLSIQKQ